MKKNKKLYIKKQFLDFFRRQFQTNNTVKMMLYYINLTPKLLVRDKDAQNYTKSIRTQVTKQILFGKEQVKYWQQMK